MNTANKLTLCRVVMIPIFIVLLYLEFAGHLWVALAVFILASVTDFVDGYVARHYDQVTDFGKFMDPLADKLLVMSAMVWFVEVGWMPAWAFFIVIARELAVTGLRLVAVEQDATGKAYQIALAYIAGIGGARAGIMETTFHDETETDLFGEQTVLCGGVVDLMQCGFETLVEAGYAPENAYFECIHEMKLIIDLINKGGVAAMNYSISDTAEFGEYVSGPRVLPHEETKARMRAVLADIQDGTFAGRWIAENKSRGRTFFNSKRDQLAKHPMEQVGEELRRNMIWGGDKDLDTASN